MLLRLPEVMKRRGRKKTPTYQDVQNELLTEPVAIGPRAVAWPEHEVEQINAARIAGKSDDEVRALVRRLMAARKSLVERGGAIQARTCSTRPENTEAAA
jgi:prophage regulatory protein